MGAGPVSADLTDVQPSAEPTAALPHAGRAVAPVPSPVHVDDEPAAPLDRRWLALLGALLVVALVAAVAFALTHRSSGTPGTGPATRPQPSATAGPTAAASVAPSEAAPPSQAPTQVSTTAATGGGPTTLPAGWHYFSDPTGFTVAVPTDWTVEHRHDGMVYFHDPTGARLLGIAQRRDPQPDPVTDWQDQERQRVAAGDFPQYEGLGIRRVDYHLGAADWEFRFTEDGVRVHVINRGAIFGPHQAYGFYWSVRNDQWDENLSNFDLITRTFQGKTD